MSGYRSIRRSAAPLFVALLLALAGCSGGLGGLAGGEDGKLSFTASPVVVSNETAKKAGFTPIADKPVTFNRSFEVGGQSRSVVAESHMLQFERSYKGAPLGSAVVLSVPQIKVLGQQIQIVKQLDVTSLMSQAGESSGDLKSDRKVGERNVTLLGGQRTIEIYAGTASREGNSAEVRIYQMAFDHGGDTIVAVAVAPKQVDAETSGVVTLFKGIRHETEEE